MSILGAATLDYIQHLKEQSKGWVFEPLVITNDDKLRHLNLFVTIKKCPNNHTSPTQFYIENPPTGLSTLIKAKMKGHYPRIIELRLAPGPTAKVNLKYWRANGFSQNEVAVNCAFYSRRNTPVQQDGETMFRVYSMERVTKRKHKKAPHIIHRDVLDLAVPKSAKSMAYWTMVTLDKSLEKTHGAGKTLSTWGMHMAVVLEGMNFMYETEGYGVFRSEIIYG